MPDMSTKQEGLDMSQDPSLVTLEETLLWVHQEPWQQQLILKYGNTISLKEATYKTTRYEMALFLLVFERIPDTLW